MAKAAKSTTQILLILSLSANFFVACYFGGKYWYYSHSAFLFRHGYIHLPGDNKQRWSDFLKSKTDTSAIFFSGTSITQNFPLMEAFNNPHIINLGFGYNQAFNIIKQAAKYINRKPKKIFLEVGINEIRHGLSVDHTYHNFVNICTIIKTKSPQTQLYVQSVLPTDVYEFNLLIKSYNQKVARYCQQNHITFIDLYPDFLRDSLIDCSLTPDGIHPNATGYFLWRRHIERYVLQ